MNALLTAQSLGDRMTTLMFYLTEVKQGGYTAFPRLGVSVRYVVFSQAQFGCCCVMQDYFIAGFVQNQICLTFFPCFPLFSHANFLFFDNFQTPPFYVNLFAKFFVFWNLLNKKTRFIMVEVDQEVYLSFSGKRFLYLQEEMLVLDI